jgi:hypothetical protein
MTIDENPEIEYSPFCEEVRRDGTTVKLQIYRLKGGTEGWSLEVVDSEDRSTVWEDLFATDQDARDEFYRTLETEGIHSFSEDRPSQSLH